MCEQQISLERALKEINNIVLKDADIIKEYIGSIINGFDSSINLENLQAFDNEVIIAKSNKDKSIKEKCGVYVFVMTEDVEIKQTFNDTPYGSKYLKPASEDEFHFKKNDILYIGKAEEIKNRMNAHFCNENQYSSTYALRLNSSNRKELLDKFKIYIFGIKKEYARYHKIINPIVEDYLHENLNYLVGKK